MFFLISPCYSLELCIQMDISFLSFSLLFFGSLLFSAVCKAFSDNHFAFLHFFFLGMVLITELLSIVLQSLCLSDLTTWIYLSLPLYNHNRFDLGIPEWSSDFPYFLQFNSEFCDKEFQIWATVSSQSCCWLYRASPFSVANNIINLISVLAIWWCPCVESSLVLLEEGVYYNQCILLAKLY